MFFFLFVDLQLQNLISDETSLQITELFKSEKPNDATGGPSATATVRSGVEQAYQKKAENILTNENCFKVVFVSSLVLLFFNSSLFINFSLFSLIHSFFHVWFWMFRFRKTLIFLSGY